MMPISHNIEYVPMDNTHSLTVTLVAGSHFPLLRKAHTLLQVDLSVVAFTLTVGSSFLYFLRRSHSTLSGPFCDLNSRLGDRP